MKLSIMSSRYTHLQQALQGYIQTGVPLVESHQGTIIATYTTDDIGIYYLIPRFSYYLNIPLDHAIQSFFYGILITGLVIGIIGLLNLFKTPYARLLSVIIPITSTLVFARYIDLDVYIVSQALALAIIPWALYFFINQKLNSRYFYLFMIASGLAIGYAHYLRAYSGIAMMLFISFLLLTDAISTSRKIILMTLLLSSMAVAKIHFSYIYHTYLSYAHTNMPEQPTDRGAHPFWHPIYLGLGFLSNSFGIIYDDSCGFKKAQECNPEVVSVSNEYETILKREVFKFLWHHKLFVLYTIWAKIGILLMFFLLCANIGIPLAYFFPKGWRIDCAFLLALLFSSLFGIIIMPLINYLAGFLTISMLYGLISINYAIEYKNVQKNIFDFVPFLKR